MKRPANQTLSEEAIRQKALALLARREHSARELSRKLTAKGAEPEVAAQVVERLRQENLLSDERFAEGFAHQRIEAGYGPIRIRHELREHGIEGDTIDRYLPRDEEEWRERISKARNKRFGEETPADYRERARQVRFLLYRGFDGEGIRAVLDVSEE
uniref:Regulatory protein RecX n=1 Tax=Candidatus Kentrum sp. DK TaxID=2126562 RepID=A0A450RYE7_9GAMM|nr:MAG: regulatory protein [Candidatus Kentron sp. DK]VFJ64435.1 MAG: regulatory protein [Candidatus Kentron sp. DK]